MASDPFINPPLPIGDRTGGGNYYQRPKRPPMPVPEPAAEPAPTAETPPDPNQMLLEALDRLRATDEHQPQQPGTDTIRLLKARKAYQESGTSTPAPPTPPDPTAQADYDGMFGPE